MGNYCAGCCGRCCGEDIPERLNHDDIPDSVEPIDETMIRRLTALIEALEERFPLDTPYLYRSSPYGVEKDRATSYLLRGAPSSFPSDGSALALSNAIERGLRAHYPLLGQGPGVLSRWLEWVDSDVGTPTSILQSDPIASAPSRLSFLSRVLSHIQNLHRAQPSVSTPEALATLLAPALLDDRSRSNLHGVRISSAPPPTDIATEMLRVQDLQRILARLIEDNITQILPK